MKNNILHPVQQTEGKSKMKNMVTVHITGTAKSGKSTILSLIKSVLMDNGFEVHHDPTPDFKNEQDFDSAMENMEKRAPVASKISIVNLKELRAND